MNIQKVTRIAIGAMTIVLGTIAFMLMGVIFVLCVIAYFFAISTRCLLEHVFETFVILNDSPGKQPQCTEQTITVHVLTADIYNLSEVRDKLRAA